MKVLAHLVVAATTVPLALSSPIPPATGATGRTGADAIYRRTLTRALERAREDLERSIELYEDHSTWADPWIVQNGPFRVRTTASWLYADRAGRNLETMIAHFETLLGRSFPRDEVRNVFVFPDIGAYNDFGDPYGHHSSILGSFYAGEDAAQPIATYYHPNDRLVGIWLTHGASHMYVSRLASRALPTWVDEGLASYFGYYYWAYDFAVGQFEQRVANDTLIPLGRLLTANLADYRDDPDTRFIELAMFFGYLLHHCEETMSPPGEVREGSFVEYLRKALRGERLNRHPVHRIINEALPELEQDFRSFSFPRYE